MPYCPHCGFSIEETMTYCPRCGAQRKTLLRAQNEAVSTTGSNGIKPRTILVNGFLIGLGIALGLVGLVLALFFNSLFLSLRENTFLIGGLQTQRLFGLLISSSFLIGMIGVQFLVLGSLNQWNRNAQRAWNLKDFKSRLASGLMTFGFLVTTLVLNSVIADFYAFSNVNEGYVWFAVYPMISVGVIFWVLGILLLIIPRKDSKS